jgi:hypothetical protein
VVIKGVDATLEIVPDNLVPAEDGPTDGVAAYVRVADHGFSGVVSVHLEHGDVKTFIRELRELERLRQGTAQLRAMSFDEFNMRIFSTTPAGRV